MTIKDMEGLFDECELKNKVPYKDPLGLDSSILI